LRDAFERRQQSDYVPMIEIDRQTVEQTLQQAIDFVDTRRKLVN
jgi:uncharacterized protein (UPF0332 family)